MLRHAHPDCTGTWYLGSKGWALCQTCETAHRVDRWGRIVALKGNLHGVAMQHAAVEGELILLRERKNRRGEG